MRRSDHGGGELRTRRALICGLELVRRELGWSRDMIIVGHVTDDNGWSRD